MDSMRNLKIEPLKIEGTSLEDNDKLTQVLESILIDWEDTPWAPGQQCCGVAVDCVHFVAAVYDQLRGRKAKLPKIAQDASFNSSETTWKALKWFFKEYEVIDVSDEEFVQPGDCLIMGPIGGGPGHGVIVGKDCLWHCGPEMVCRAGLSIHSQGVYYLKAIKRIKHREEWLKWA